jgi:hypothetical protein
LLLRLAAFLFLLFVARLRAFFTLRFVIAFLRMAILPLGMIVPFGSVFYRSQLDQGCHAPPAKLRMATG